MDSVWRATTKQTGFPPLKQNQKTDVLIIGGGMAGVLCAYRLGQAGIPYILVEADKIGGGITKNTTAKITAQHGLIYDKITRQFDRDTARLYYEAQTRALQQYKHLCADIPCDFEQQHAFIYSLDAPAKIEAEIEEIARQEEQLWAEYKAAKEDAKRRKAEYKAQVRAEKEKAKVEKTKAKTAKKSSKDSADK